MKAFTRHAAIAVLSLSLAIPLAALAGEIDMGAAVGPDHTMRTSLLLGGTVYNEQGQPFGTIFDILVKPGAVEPTAILSVGDYVGGGQKLIAVPLSHVKLEGAKPTMAGASKQQLASMPSWGWSPRIGNGG